MSGLTADGLWVGAAGLALALWIGWLIFKTCDRHKRRSPWELADHDVDVRAFWTKNE